MSKYTIANAHVAPPLCAWRKGCMQPVGHSEYAPALYILYDVTIHPVDEEHCPSCGGVYKVEDDNLWSGCDVCDKH